MVPTRSQDGRRGHARRPFLALFLALFAGCDGERAAVVPEPVQPDPLGNPAYRRAAGVVLLAAEVRLPFHGDPCEPPEGYMVEIVRECLHLHGWELEHVAVTRERGGWPGALDGTFDGVLGLTREEGPGLIFPAGDLAVDPVALVVLNDSPWQWDGPGQPGGPGRGSSRGQPSHTRTGCLALRVPA
jgi:hypothetical protein